jgi:hypothetical protein
MVKCASYALWALLLLAMFFRLNLTPSEPLGLYRVTREPLTRGTFVLLDSPLKRIAGMPGDTVRATEEGSYINGKLWPLSAIPGDSTLPHYPTARIRCGMVSSGYSATMPTAMTVASSGRYPEHSLAQPRGQYGQSHDLFTQP